MKSSRWLLGLVVSGFKVTGQAVCGSELVFGKDRPRPQEAGRFLFGHPHPPVVSLTSHGILYYLMPCPCGNSSFLSPSGNKGSEKWVLGRTSWEREVGHSSHSMTGMHANHWKVWESFAPGFLMAEEGAGDMVCECALYFLLHFYNLCVSICMRAGRMCVEVRGYVVGILFLLPPHGVWLHRRHLLDRECAFLAFFSLFTLEIEPRHLHMPDKCAGT